MIRGTLQLSQNRSLRKTIDRTLWKLAIRQSNMNGSVHGVRVSALSDSRFNHLHLASSSSAVLACELPHTHTSYSAHSMPSRNSPHALELF